MGCVKSREARDDESSGRQEDGYIAHGRPAPQAYPTQAGACPPPYGAPSSMPPQYGAPSSMPPQYNAQYAPQSHGYPPMPMPMPQQHVTTMVLPSHPQHTVYYAPPPHVMMPPPVPVMPMGVGIGMGMGLGMGMGMGMCHGGMGMGMGMGHGGMMYGSFDSLSLNSFGSIG